MEGALNHVSPQGIHSDEWLLPEMLKQRGYATGIFGKWHLGLSPTFSPLKNGFDKFFGIPYSNDNSKYHPSLASEMPPLPLYDGDTVVEHDPDQSRFTQRLTERAIAFIDHHQSEPFFLYVPMIMPHVPIFASESFRGRSPHGLYADVVEELDWAVGQIVAKIDALGLASNTCILFASDNGPFLSYGSHAGSAGKLREGKLTSFDGGVRVPCIARWSNKIPAGQVCDVPWMTIDLLPTLAAWTQAELPKLKYDGVDASEWLFGRSKVRPETAPLLFYSGAELQAVRVGKWKLHLAHQYIAVDGQPGSQGKPAGYGKLKPKSISQSGIAGIASRHGYRVQEQPQALYDLSTDVGEARDVAAQNPDVVERMLQIVELARQDLGDAIVSKKGTQVRACGTSTSR
jgi:arylsulfatase